MAADEGSGKAGFAVTFDVRNDWTTILDEFTQNGVV
jgi:hypothetical protein